MLLSVERVAGLAGVAEIPGDKSVSHRALMLGALAGGTTRISGFLAADDCLRTLTALESLGVDINTRDTSNVEVEGVGLKGFREPDNVLDVGNSGTTLRIVSGILAGQDFFSVLTGDESLRKRPMDRIISPLRSMGASIWARQDTFCPLAFRGRNLTGIEHETPIPSAQVKSALLLAGLSASGSTTVREQYQSRDHTERMLEFFGADVSREDTAVTVVGGRDLNAQEIDVPGDFSSAMFLIVGALITPESDVVLKNVGVNPTRTGALRVLKEMGAEIEQLDHRERCNEPRADIRVKSSALKAVRIGAEIVPQLIDELPILAVAATQAKGVTEIRGAKELRVKESDRIRTVKSELEKLGAAVNEYEDGFSITGPIRLGGANCESFGDHRIAMSLAVAGLAAEGKTSVRNAQCTNVSFPHFEKTLRSLVR